MIKLVHGGREYICDDAKQLIAAGVPESVANNAELEYKSLLVRKERDNLLQETDWTQVVDSPLPDDKKAEFAVYRQALRDIPQTYSDPDLVVWPEKPTI